MIIALGLACWAIPLTIAGYAFDFAELRYAAMDIALIGLAFMVLYLGHRPSAAQAAGRPRQAEISRSAELYLR